MASQQDGRVPGGVGIVAVLAIAIGIVQLIAGVLLIIFSGDVDGYSTTAAVVFGIITLLVGLIYVWVGRGLLNLDPAAWLVGVFVSGFRVAYDLIWLIVLGLDGIGITTLIALIINLLVFAALWSGRSAFNVGGPDTAQPA